MLKCDFDCFNCIYDDCILDSESSSSLSSDINLSREIDNVLFEEKKASSIVVPDYRLYPFIPSDEIPYNSKWRSQARWREYYRSKMRGNRDEKIRALSREYYQNHREKRKEYGKKYYSSHRDQRIAYGRKYRLEHREENIARCRENYILNREKRLAYQKEYCLRKKSERNNLLQDGGKA